MHRTIRVALVCLVLAVGAVAAATGRQLLVSKDALGAYRSVQGALNEAVAGDTILVSPGAYEEQIEFKNGVTIVGSGAERTIIRYGYGFEEVFRARNTVSGRVEGLTLERMNSVLDAPVVVLESAGLEFVDCTITGGQLEGVQVRGLSAHPTFESCDIRGNALHGLLCEDHAIVRIRGGTIRGNGGAGLLAIDAEVHVDGTRFDTNRTTGLVLEGSAAGTVRDAYFSAHRGWGVEALEDAELALEEDEFTDNLEGGLRLADSAAATVRATRIAGGGIGILISGSANAVIAECGIGAAGGPGVRFADEAGGSIERTEIVGGNDHGLELASSGDVAARFLTIVDNGGDGMRASGTSIRVTDTIIAVNAGAGLHVDQDLAVSDPPVLGYNTVWGNRGGDYVGTARRSSDRSEYPEFVDPRGGDYTLRLDSPCIGAGERNATIGAHIDPSRQAGTTIELIVRDDAGPWGLDLLGSARFTAEPPFLDGIRIRAGRGWERFAFSIASSFLGPDSERLEAATSIHLVDVQLGSDTSAVSPTLDTSVGGAAILAGIGTHSNLWIRGGLEAATYALRAELTWERPSGITHQSADLRLGPFSLSTRATAWTLQRLDVALSGEIARQSGALFLSAALASLPEPMLTLQARLGSDTWELETTAESALQDLGFAVLTATWSDIARGSRIDLRAEVSDSELADASLRASLQLGDLSIASEVGVDTELGVRLRVALEIDTAAWFIPTPNLLPVPAFGYGPFEPEIGEPIIFDAAAAVDPDGTIVEYWWDFGDGHVDIGQPVSHPYDQPGEYHVALTVADDRGDTATLLQSVIVFDAETTPVAAFTWGPISEAGTSLARPLRAGDRVGLDATSSYDPDGSILEYAWDLESDGAFDLVTAEPFAGVDPFPVGTWPVTLRVLDDTGRTDAIMRVLRVEDPKLPEAAFEASPASPSVFDPVRFLNRSFETDSPIISWEWRFGDGHESRQPEPTHRFEEPGTYDVALTVTDALGLADTTSTTIKVARDPEVVPVDDVWALVVGISDYDEVDDLPYGRRDAEAVAAWLLDRDVPSDHIRILTDSEEGDGAARMPTLPATLVNVREGLGWLRQVATRDDLVIIHFSGHGYQGADDSGDELDDVDEFFVLADTRAAAKDDTALRDDEFGRFLDRIESEHVLIFFDSCYSGGLSRSLTPGRRATGDPQDWFGDLRLEGRLILSASSEGEEAFESPELEHGVFTHFLLMGLGGAADLNADYHVTVWELYEYVAARVPDYVDAERGEPQHPQLIGEGETRIILSLRERPLEAAFSYCPRAPYAGGPVTFTDESLSSSITSRKWAFGDGAVADGSRAVHTFSEPGTFDVVLTIHDEAGTASRAAIEIHVDPPGQVLGVDPVSGHIVISLGSQHGVRIGDRFAASAADAADAAFESPSSRPILEILELLDEDQASCHIIEAEAETSTTLPVGAPVVPIAPTPCSTSTSTTD